MNAGIPASFFLRPDLRQHTNTRIFAGSAQLHAAAEAQHGAVGLRKPQLPPVRRQRDAAAHTVNNRRLLFPAVLRTGLQAGRLPRAGAYRPYAAAADALALQGVA